MPFYYEQITGRDKANSKSKRVENAIRFLARATLVVYSVVSIVEPFIPIGECKDEHFKESDTMLVRRMLASSFLGAIIGWERRAADRPAGIRTMSLVSMGACLFTITSIYGFMDGPQTWDASRVTAAIPSGVGFLGAGLMWKSTHGSGDDTIYQVHGLTTAASVWLAASVGVACGGGLFFISIFSVILIVMVLKYGPSVYMLGEDDKQMDRDDDSFEMSADEERPHRHQRHHHHLSPHPTHHHLHLSPPQTESYQYTSAPLSTNIPSLSKSCNSSWSGKTPETQSPPPCEGTSHSLPAEVKVGHEEGGNMEANRTAVEAESASSISEYGTSSSYSSNPANEQTRLLRPTMRPGKKPNPNLFKRQATFNL